MRWSREQYEAYEQKRNAKNTRIGRSSELQELQDDSARKADNRPNKTEVDGAMHPRYRVAATFFVADNRDRDGDGMYSTIQDCLIAAIGRLAEMDRLALRRLAKSEERKRGI